MWIEEQGGKYKYREKYRDPRSGKVKTVSVVLDRKNAKQARAILAEKIEEKTRVGDYTLQQAAELYKKDQRRSVQESTAERNITTINVLVKLLGGDNYMDRITAGYVRERLLTQKKTNTSMNEQIRRFRAFFRWSYRNGLVSSPACADKLSFFPEPPRRARASDKFMEKDELQKLLDGMDDEGYRLITQFLALSGLRIGELIALDVTDVHDDYVDIAKGYALRKHKVKSMTKTSTSFRPLHLQPQLKECLNDLMSYMNQRKKRLKTKVSYLCIDRHGQRIQYDTYRKYLRIHSEKTLGRRITPHVLRHTHASLLAENDVPLDTTQRRLGHANSAVTRDIYTHITQTRRKKDDAILDGVKI